MSLYNPPERRRLSLENLTEVGIFVPAIQPRMFCPLRDDASERRGKKGNMNINDGKPYDQTRDETRVTTSSSTKIEPEVFFIIDNKNVPIRQAGYTYGEDPFTKKMTFQEVILDLKGRRSGENFVIEEDTECTSTIIHKSGKQVATSCSKTHVNTESTVNKETKNSTLNEKDLDFCTFSSAAEFEWYYEQATHKYRLFQIATNFKGETLDVLDTELGLSWASVDLETEIRKYENRLFHAQKRYDRYREKMLRDNGITLDIIKVTRTSLGLAWADYRDDDESDSMHDSMIDDPSTSNHKYFEYRQDVKNALEIVRKSLKAAEGPRATSSHGSSTHHHRNDLSVQQREQSRMGASSHMQHMTVPGTLPTEKTGWDSD